MITNDKIANLLRIEGVTRSFGGVRAISNFTFSLSPGAIAGIIGPNGAGKTTVFNLITGVYRPDAGRIYLKGADITGLPSHEIIARGISRTFQNIRLFKSMSVLENVVTAAFCRARYPLWSALLRTSRFGRAERGLREEAARILDTFGLTRRLHEPASGLAYGLRRKVELARALMGNPSVVLLDEPGAGMNPSELDGLADLILWMRGSFACAIVLIEHRMPLVMRICESVTVMNFGEVIFTGKPPDLAGNDAVVKAYFGESDEPA